MNASWMRSTPIGAPRRAGNREHYSICRATDVPPLVGRKPCDPHHLRFMQPRALDRKASDEFTVPLCRIHHRTLHRAVDERAWWQQAGIEPVQAARQFWNETRGTKEERALRGLRPLRSQIARSRSLPWSAKSSRRRTCPPAASTVASASRAERTAFRAEKLGAGVSRTAGA